MTECEFECANWFNELKEIDEKDKIVSIFIRDKNKVVHEFKSIDEAKYLLDYDFDSGYGAAEGPSFTAWGIKEVYFPHNYDGSEYIQSVPRNPTNFVTYHCGEVQ